MPTRIATLAAVCLLILGLHGQTKAAKIHYGQEISSHIEAVGAVAIYDGPIMSLGTGTYIGENNILTAAHLFQYLLPKTMNKKTGPVIIDLHDKDVYWSPQEKINRQNPVRITYKAKALILDAEFINEFAANTEPPNINDIKCDFAILILEKTPDTPKVELTLDLPRLPSQGIHIGYGFDSRPGHYKETSLQAISGQYDLETWGVVVTNNPKNYELTRSDIEKNPEHLKKLLAKSHLSRKDLAYTTSTQGDSGGPLLYVDEHNKIKILGTMSAHSDNYNAITSLVIKTPQGYQRSPHLLEMLKVARQVRS